MLLNDNRAVVHMDLDTFFVSVERLRDRRLQNLPLIVGGTGNRGVVCSCSYETRAFGVHSGMSMRQARMLCPSATVIAGDFERYCKYSQDVTEIVRAHSPLFEKASIDEFYIDLTGMERFFGVYAWATDLRKRIVRETGLPISMGLAANKTVAKIATNEIKPNGQLQVQRGMEQAFLDPLLIGKIPMIGAKTTQYLNTLGVRHVHALRAMPIDYLERILGKFGLLLWQRARGIDNSPITPYSERKSISSEQTFGEDTTDMVGLRATLARMTERLAFTLRETNKLTACITVKIRYADFTTFTKQAHIPYTANDHELGQKTQKLFEQLYDRRRKLRLVGVRYSHLIAGGHQIHLFEDTATQLQLYQAIDKIKYRYGSDAVLRANAFGRISRGDRRHEELHDAFMIASAFRSPQPPPSLTVTPAPPADACADGWPPLYTED
jgi:DNA polymerase-4